MVAKRSVAPDRCMTDDEVASSGTIMDATRLAAVCAKIEEYAAGSGGAPMSGRRVAAICAMIDDRATAGKTRRNKLRKKLCMDSTRSYKQIGEIGHGGFGAVVKARHRTTGQTVAIKTFTEGPDVSELLREACFLAACGGHPHLVGLHAVARDPRTKKYSLVMEYVGPSLRHALKERLRVHGGRPFPEAEVRRIMRQLLSGAEAMHAHRIIHRDIKTGNVLVSEDGSGVVKICDYGLAMSAAATAGPPYDRVGTASYMAPEVLMRRTDYDERVDTWSLGCVMAELLSGEVLFKVGNGGAHSQLDRMFDVLGAPDGRALQAFAPPFAVGKVLRRLARRPWSSRRHDGRLRELFPRETLSRDGLDVLKGLLTFNPKERLTAAAALRLPWFSGAVDAPASEIGATASLPETAWSFVRVLTGVLTFLRRMALKLIRLPRHYSRVIKAS